MKMLTVIVLVQLLAVAVLLVKVISLDDKLPVPMVEQPVGPSTIEVSAPKKGSQVATVRFPEDRLREIIREELSARLDGVADAQNSSTPAPSPVSEAEYVYRRELVAQKLQYYANVGQITRPEMAALEGQIAGLSEEDRPVMLKELVRALNTGAIDGRL
jgi:hypothetical protein